MFDICIHGIDTAKIFNDFAISREPIDAIDLNFFYLKCIDQKITPNPSEPDRTKIREVRAK